MLSWLTYTLPISLFHEVNGEVHRVLYWELLNIISTGLSTIYTVNRGFLIMAVPETSLAELPGDKSGQIKC